MNTKHTPGPWVDGDICGDHNVGIGRYRLITGGGELIAHTWPDSSEHEEANARLIAAAPELLAACQEFLRFADLPNECVPRGDYIRYQVSAISAARAAIAKAEGGEA